MVDPPRPDSTSPIEERSQSSQFVGFQVADQQYAFRIEQIQEIVILESVTPTPQVPAYVEGVSNLRGAIIPIINLRILFDIDPAPRDSETRTIVVNVGDRTMGCTVDMVSHVIRIPEDDIEPAPETVTAEGADYIEGFANHEDRLVIILDIGRLFSAAHLERIASSNRRSSPTS